MPDQQTRPVRQGVYFRPEDSPGVIVRALIDLVDLTVVVTIFVLIEHGCIAWGFDPQEHRNVIIACAALLSWGYLVPLKWSRMGTLGYLIFRVKVQDLLGQRPGLARLTLRVLLTLGLNTFVDLIYVAGDPARQALRDKLTGTCVVRRSAVPTGTGPLVRAQVFFLGYCFTFHEVRRRP